MGIVIKKCLYCKEEFETKPNKGEHVFPNYIFKYFGKEQNMILNYKQGFINQSEGKINNVCSICNNGFLSEIDNESSHIIKKIFDCIYENHNNNLIIFKEKEDKENLIKFLIKTYINNHIYYSSDEYGNELPYINNDLDYELYNFFCKYIDNKFNIIDDLNKYSIYLNIDPLKFLPEKEIFVKCQITDYKLSELFNEVYAFNFQIPNIQIILLYKNKEISKIISFYKMNFLKPFIKLRKNIYFSKIPIYKTHFTKEDLSKNIPLELKEISYTLDINKKILVLIMDNSIIKNLIIGNNYFINSNNKIINDNNDEYFEIDNIIKENNIKDIENWKLGITSKKDFMFEAHKNPNEFDEVMKFLKNLKPIKKI